MLYNPRRPFSAALAAYRRAASVRLSWKPSACSTSLLAIVQNRLARTLFGRGASGGRYPASMAARRACA
eukprot:14291663-Alexandrium_andersonii.AAC.1